MKKIVEYYKCECGEKAVWLYMPSSSDNPFYCDNCVSRGCSCHVRNINNFSDEDLQRIENEASMYWWSKNDYEKSYKEGIEDEFASKTRQPDSFYYEFLDDNGRRWPCCEYDYNPNGYEINE